MGELAKVFKALSDETRVRMLVMLLVREELCVCDFMNILSIPHSTASRHLRYMLNAGLLDDRREAVWVHYRISRNLTEEIKILLEALKRIFSASEYRLLRAKLNNYLKKKTSGGKVMCGRKND